MIPKILVKTNSASGLDTAEEPDIYFMLTSQQGQNPAFYASCTANLAEMQWNSDSLKIWLKDTVSPFYL